MATGDAAVTVLLAEYNALRTEFERKSQAQQTLVNLALTLSGALVAYAVAHNEPFVLLLQPPVASSLGLLFANHGGGIRRIARYIAEHTEQRLDALTGESGLMVWEGRWAPLTRRWRFFWLFAPLLAFVGTSSAVLALTARRTWSLAPRRTGLLAPAPWASRGLWIFGLATVTLCVVGFWFAFRTQRLRRA